jgi:hypothetical protein
MAGTKPEYAARVRWQQRLDKIVESDDNQRRIELQVDYIKRGWIRPHDEEELRRLCRKVQKKIDALGLITRANQMGEPASTSGVVFRKHDVEVGWWKK